MKVILRKLIAVIVIGWGVFDILASQGGIEVYSKIGINLPVWIAFFTPIIAFFIGGVIWYGTSNDSEEEK